MSTIQALFLGIIQGLTEFLPVSSSGHLVLGQALIGVKEPGAGFVVFAHFGTLLAILLHYRADLTRMTVSVLRRRWDQDTRLVLLLALGTIPAAVVGFGLKSHLEGLFDEPSLAAAMLLVTGAVLLLTRLAPSGEDPVRPRSALLIGCAQAVAILPGISRSGSTIATGMFLGVDRKEAARFSFLLAIPAILGPTVFELKEVIGAPAGTHSVSAYAIGAVAAFTSGYFALRLLLRLVAKGRLDPFGWYCIAVGAGALVLLNV